MKLYEFAPTRSIRVPWMLQELGVDFEYLEQMDARASAPLRIAAAFASLNA